MQRRALIVDDDVATCELIEKTVSSAGMETTVLTDGRDAIRFLKGAKFDLIFLAFTTNGSDGLEIARQVRQVNFNRTTPIILISDDLRPCVVSVGFEAGASFMLYKPIDRERLLRILRATQSTLERERRRTRRVAVRSRVRLRWGNEDVEGETIDLSLSGMLVKAQKACALGTRLQMSLDLGAGRKPIQGLGLVARLTQGGQMGIQMDRLESQANERLEEFLLPLLPEESVRA